MGFDTHHNHTGEMPFDFVFQLMGDLVCQLLRMRPYDHIEIHYKTTTGCAAQA